MTRGWRLLTAILWLAGAPAALAAVTASVQPERITLGNTATLTLVTDEAGAEPDLTPLQGKFTVRGTGSSLQTSFINGRETTKLTWQIEIEPTEAGILGVPPIQIGAEQTPSLTLTVMPPQPGSASNGDPYFLQTEVSQEQPYVQQALVYTVRLYYAVPLIDGNVDTSGVQNASLQQIGEDQNRQEEIGGRRYNVFERRYLLIPEQSGPLTLPQARFRGRMQRDGGRGFFASVENVSAVSPSKTLTVRPQPDAAPQPWLPARALTLTRADVASGARAGEPLMLELQLTADGVTEAQLADLTLPTIPGAQVFPEPAQTQTTLVSGLPVTRRTQRFAIVPAQAGALTIPAIEIAYWNTERDQADVARLAPLTLDIAPGSAQPISVAPAAAVASSAPVSAPVVADRNPVADPGLWRIATLALLVAWALTAWWGWRRGRRAAAPTAPPVPRAGTLAQALRQGELAGIAAALRQDSGCLSLGAVARQLKDPAQRAALQALDAALWSAQAGADSAHLLAQLRSAFAGGLKTDAAPAATARALPELYPR